MVNDYQQAWKLYKRLKLQLLLMFLGIIPVGRAVDIASLKILHSEIPYAVLMLIYFIILFATGCRVAMWPCPKCGKPFLGGWFHYDRFSRTCLRCGLPKDSD